MNSRWTRIAQRIARDADPSSISLKAEYQKLNRELFDGELPSIPLKWMKSRRAGGWVKATINRRSGEITIKELGVSTFLKRTYEQFLGILAHEMIHVYWLANGKNEGHGIFFKAKLYELKRKASFDIPLTESIAGMELSEEAKQTKREVGVVLFDMADGKSRCAVYSLNAFTRQYVNLHTYVLRFAERVASGYEVLKAYLLVSDNPELQKYPAKRKVSRDLYRCPNDLARELKRDGKMWDEFDFESSTQTASRK
jgi:hypothetical protein